MNATTVKRAPRNLKSAAKRVDIQTLSAKQLAALPEDVFLASLKPKLRKSVQAAFRLKGVL